MYTLCVALYVIIVGVDSLTNLTAACSDVNMRFNRTVIVFSVIDGSHCAIEL